MAEPPAGELAALKARLEALEAAKESQEEELKALRLENEKRQAEYEAWKTDKDKLKRWVCMHAVYTCSGWCTDRTKKKKAKKPKSQKAKTAYSC